MPRPLYILYIWLHKTLKTSHLTKRNIGYLFRGGCEFYSIGNGIHRLRDSTYPAHFADLLCGRIHVSGFPISLSDCTLVLRPKSSCIPYMFISAAVSFWPNIERLLPRGHRFVKLCRTIWRTVIEASSIRVRNDWPSV